MEYVSCPIYNAVHSQKCWDQLSQSEGLLIEQTRFLQNKKTTTITTRKCQQKETNKSETKNRDECFWNCHSIQLRFFVLSKREVSTT